MTEQCPTAKIIHKDDKSRTVYTIDLHKYDAKKHDLAGENEVPKELPKLDPAKKEMLFGSGIQPSTFTVDGKTVQLGIVVAKAHTDSGLTVDQWNALPQDAREEKIQAAVDEMFPIPPLYILGKSGRGNAIKYFVLDKSTGKRVNPDEDFATEDEVKVKIEELMKA